MCLLPAAVWQKIAGVDFRGLKNNTEQKVMNMLGYLAELTYNICITPGDKCHQILDSRLAWGCLDEFGVLVMVIAVFVVVVLVLYHDS